MDLIGDQENNSQVTYNDRQCKTYAHHKTNNK
jgi:hypothetical protein